MPKKRLEKGRKEGEKRGEFIGKINLAQRLLKRPITPKNDLIGKSLKDLRIILKQIEAELNI